MIAKQSGSSIGLTYVYYATKEALLLSIMEEGFTAIQQQILLINTTTLLKKDTVDELMLLIDTFTHTMTSHYYYWKIQFEASIDNELRILLDSNTQKFHLLLHQKIHSFFHQAGADSPEDETIFLLTFLKGIFIQHSNQNTFDSNVFSTQTKPALKEKYKLIRMWLKRG